MIEASCFFTECAAFTGTPPRLWTAQSQRRPWAQCVATFVRGMRFLFGYLGQLARAHGFLLPLGSAGAAKAGFSFQLCTKWDGPRGFRDAHVKMPSGKIPVARLQSSQCNQVLEENQHSRRKVKES